MIKNKNMEDKKIIIELDRDNGLSVEFNDVNASEIGVALFLIASDNMVFKTALLTAAKCLLKR